MNTNLAYASERIVEAFHRQVEITPKKYTALYLAIKQCIKSEDLPANWDIPATRKLSETLGISRTTVITAYELLLLEKLIIAKPGSGYKIADNTDEKEIESELQSEKTPACYPAISQKGQAFLENVGLLNRGEDAGIAFKPGLPPIDSFPINKWKNLLNVYWRYIRSSDLSYGQTTGTYHLKEQITNYLKVSRAIKVSPEQIIIVSGSLQSIYLVASAVIDVDDAVVVENPTFPNVHSIFKSFRSKLIPISIDEEGLKIDELKLQTKNEKPKIIHLTPSNHYPLGSKMSLNRRKSIVQWASENKAYIIENDYEHEVGNESVRLPSIYNLDTENRTIYLGTFNRLLYPSIRLGFMIVPKPLVHVIQALQEHSHRFVAPSIQIVMGQFIEKNFLYQHLENMVEVAKKRFNIFMQTIENENTNKVRILQNSFCSLHSTLVFHPQISRKKEKQIINELANKGISVFPLSKCYVNKSVETGLIVGFSTLRSSQIPEKTKILLRTITENTT